MSRLIRLVPLIGLILLQACQHSPNLEHGTQAKKQRAAFYNTQLGMAYLKQGDRQRAKQKLLSALALAPRSAEVREAMAYYLEKTGDIEQAHRYYAKALSLAPQSGAQLNNYGAFLCRIGKYKESLNYFAKAVKDIHYINTAGAYENAGLCAVASGDYTQANYYFIKALAHDPERKQSLYELVNLELKQGRVDAALGHLHRRRALFLSSPSLLALGIEAAHRLGKVEEEKNFKKRLTNLTRFRTLLEQKNEHYNNNNG